MYNSIYDTLIIGKKVIYLPSCHSTNDIAAELVRSGVSMEGAVVITDDQTKGRGQRGTTWVTQPRMNLTMSVILTPSFLSIQDQFLISQAMALGISSYLSNYSDKVKIKWPNDIYIGSRKICGTLIENSIQGSRLASSVVGMGINVNQIDFSNPRATSLARESGKDFLLTDEFYQLIHHLDAWYLKLKSTKNNEEIRQLYLANLFGYKELCLFRYQSEIVPGTVTGITNTGKLCVKFENQSDIKELDLKEVEWIWD
ncbi:biotin--[acetyl-CoA-carboxylase] ligase [Dyadobacter sp. CY356]|uniref:biotin--[acetyl-CoA-carboxylase] ligase n=1 Tax=Dyadobacter sp. CY356 TaxID=2906442 RepID=UPI001F258CBD|nr:biotin--[acetyl-CoA-carboxylase] ligase [Dyadobacter sp. CY356]MCF0057316.1 biotin--[acetyl-CoA-carboxylase] ligase [Dyadobacter sp. CY356]